MSSRATTQYLSLDRALDAILNRGAKLVLTKTAAGPEWLLMPRGARLRPSDIHRIVHRADIMPIDGGLFAGMPQTWGRRTNLAT